jgi:hypothetical protein
MSIFEIISLSVRDGQSQMNTPADPPPGMIPVPLAKGCVLLLTEREFTAGLKRGEWWKRRAAVTAQKPHERRGEPRRSEGLHCAPKCRLLRRSQRIPLRLEDG